MNDTRRKELAAISALISEAWSRLEGVRDEEQDAFDNMPESFQNGERGEAMTEAIDKLSEHCDALQTVSGELDELTGN